MEIKAFKPGQTVYIMGTDRRDRGDHAARKAEVAKVGRKYVTISGRWGERFRETVGRSKPYLIEEMEYGSPPVPVGSRCDGVQGAGGAERVGAACY